MKNLQSDAPAVSSVGRHVRKRSIFKTTRRLAGRALLGTAALSLCFGSVRTAHAALKTWNGGGTTTNWSEAANWSGTAPVAGDDLLFTGSTKLINGNDFLAPFDINSITYNSSGFINAPKTNGPGYALMITNGIMDAAGNNTNNIPLILGGSQSISNLVGGTFTVFGNTLSMSNRSLTIGGAGTVSFTGVISGASPGETNTITVNDGTTRLAGANTFNGDVIVNSGTLQLGNAGGIPSGAGKGNLILASGAALDLGNVSPSINALNGAGVVDENPTTNAGSYIFTIGNANSNGVFSGSIQNSHGTISLVKTGTGTQSIQSPQYYGGSTTVSGGTLSLNGGGSILSTNISVATNSTLVFDTPTSIPGSSSFVNLSFAQGASVDFHLANSSGGYGFNGNLSAGRASSFATDISGNLTMYSGNLTMVPGAAGTLTLNGSLTLAGGTINYDLNTNNAVGGGTNDLIAVNGAINLNGTTQIKIKPLEGAMSGTYTLMTGTQPITGSASAFQLAAPRGITATFDTTSQPKNVLATVTGFPNPANLVWAGSGSGGAWDVEVSQNWLSNGVPDLFYDLDNVRFDDAAGTANGTVNLPNSVSPSSVVVSNSAVTYTFGVQNTDPGLISGTGSLVKDGNGTLILNGANNFSGDTIVNRGTLVLGAPITGGSANNPVLYNGITPAQLILGNGGIYQEDQANTFLTQPFTNLVIHPGGSSISQRGRQSNSTTYWVAVSNIVRQVGGTLDFNSIQGKAGNSIGIYITNNSGVTTVNGILGGWAVWGEGAWVVPISTGNGSFAYNTYQTNSNPSLWGSTSNILVNATPSTVANSETINSLQLQTAATITIGSGVSLTLASGGLLQPTAATGSATITGGTLLGSPSGDLIVNGYSLANSVTIGSTIADNGGPTALTKSGQGTLILTGNNTYSGATYINGPTIAASSGALPGTPFAASTLQIGSGGTSGSISSLTVNDLGTLAFNRSDSLTYGGVISGYGGVKQAGAGTTILTADNTYSGATTITAGTLQIGNGGAIGSINNSANVANAGTLAFNRSGSVSYGGVISGIGSLNVQSGTVTLTTNETYTGSTTVSGGTLALGANGSISNSALVTVASAGTLDASAAGGLTLNNQTVLAAGNIIGNLTAQSGTGIKPGGDSTIGALNLTGNLTLNGGTVTMDVNGASMDLINVQGSVNLSSPSVIVINNLGAPIANGTYKLIGYTGSLNGNLANLAVQFPFQAGQLASLSSSTPNEIDLVVVTYIGAALTWVGDGSANLWNVAGALNFTNASGVPTAFHNNDNVSFNDAGAANSSVNLSGSVLPASVTVSSSGDYTFQGSGSIAGGSLLKDGPDNLNVLTTNSYSGSTTISNGAVVLGNGSVNGTLGSGSINNQATLTFNEFGNVIESGAMSGPGTLNLNGPATVTLTGNNSGFSGPVNINAGILQVGSGSSGSLGTGPVTNNSALVLSRSDSGLNVSSSITGTGSVTNNGAGVVTLSGANSYAGVTYLAAGTLKAGSPGAIPSGTGVGNVEIDGGATAGVLDLNGQNVNINGLNGSNGTVLGIVMSSSGSSTLTLGNGDAAGTYSGTIKDGSGKLTLIKTGAGTQDLDIPTAVANTFSGGLVISNGIVVVTSPGGNSPANTGASQAALGSGPITFYGTNSTLSFGGSVTPIAQSTTPTWNNWVGTIVIPAGQTGIINGPQRGQISPVVQGSGTLIYQTAYVRGQYGGDASAFTGQVLLSGGTGGNNLGLQSASGWPNAHVYLTNGIFLYNQLAGTPTIPIGELSGDPSVVQTISGNDGGTEAATAANFAIGGLNTSTNFAGTIQFNVGIVKVGTGTLSLDSSTLTYTGPTAVSNGVLVFTATVPAGCSDYAMAAPGILDVSPTGAGGTLNVGSSSAQTVEGNGTLRGSLAVGGSGSVYVGFSNAIGTLTITNDVNLGGTTYMELNRTNANGTNDMITSQTMTLGGTLNVTNIGPALHVGDTFKLFKTTGALSGTFAQLNLATNDANGMAYTWTDNTAVNGSITVASVSQAVNPNPTNITVSVSGGNLTISWPADHIGWTLQEQTNGLTNTVWQDVPGSSAINTTNIPINPTVPNVFYRLHLSQ